MIDERLSQIADHYGLDKQLDMLQEECAELIQAVSKYKRTRTTAIVEEMADVYIMLYQITYLLNKEAASVDVEDFIAMWIEKKIRRQLERMKGGATLSEEHKPECEDCDHRKFTKQFIDGVVDVMVKNGISSFEELASKLKGEEQ